MSDLTISDVNRAAADAVLDLALKRLARIAADNQGNHMHQSEARALLADYDRMRDRLLAVRAAAAPFLAASVSPHCSPTAYLVGQGLMVADLEALRVAFINEVT